jgi:hypothetical protein
MAAAKDADGGEIISISKPKIIEMKWHHQCQRNGGEIIINGILIMKW